MRQNRVKEQPRPRGVVLIVSDNVHVRKRCRRALKRSFVIYEISEKTSLEYVLRQLKPTVLLLDLGLRRPGGLYALPSIQRLSPLTKIIVLTYSPKLSEEVFAIKFGAKGYCKNDINRDLLMKAVRLVQRGEIWAGRKVIPNLLEEILALREPTQIASPKLALLFHRLTIRKLEIARLVAEGASNKEIGRELHVTEATVKAHLAAIFRKLNLAGRVQLAALVTSRVDRVTAPQEIDSF